jgi:hypothetical protein
MTVKYIVMYTVRVSVGAVGDLILSTGCNSAPEEKQRSRN